VVPVPFAERQEGAADLIVGYDLDRHGLFVLIGEVERDVGRRAAEVVSALLAHGACRERVIFRSACK
jgi:hypothetical protein